MDSGTLAFAGDPQKGAGQHGGLDVVWNTMIAPWTLGEKLSKTVIFGVVLIAGSAPCS